MSPTPTPKEVATRWFEEVWNQRRADHIEQLMAPDAVGNFADGARVDGPASFRDFYQQLLTALPDIHITILRIASEGEDACVLWESTATHTGDALGLKATNQRVTFQGSTWLRIVDGKIAEGWDNWNQSALMAKLATPPTS